MKTVHTSSSDTPVTLPFATVGIAILLMLLILILYGLSVTILVEPAQRGIFGDMFGALNAAFSGFAFAGILVSLSQQRSAILQARIEFQAALDAQTRDTEQKIAELRFSAWQQELVKTQTARSIVQLRIDQCQEPGTVDHLRLHALKTQLRKLDIHLDTLLFTAD